MTRSFTLIELLIVVIIVGILATVALPQYNKVVEKARWTEVVNMLGAIETACELYYVEHGVRPHTPLNRIILNGNAKDAEASWLSIEVPDPTRSVGNYRFIYTLHLEGNSGDRCVSAHHEKTGDDEWTNSDEYQLVIDHNRNLFSRRGGGWIPY